MANNVVQRILQWVFVAWPLTLSAGEGLSVKVKNETGLFTPLTSNGLLGPSFTNDFDLETTYQFERSMKITGQVQPQWYGIERPFFSMGYALETEASYRYGTYDFTANLGVNSKNYLSQNINIYITQYLLNTNWLWYYQTQRSLFFDVNYGFRIFRNENEYRMQLANLTVVWLFSYSPYTKFGIGGHLEYFWIANSAESASSSNLNRGWRLGPVIHAKYIRSVIFSVDYSLLSHFSHQTNGNSYEHWLKILLGKSLTPSLTILFLVDYQLRAYQTSSGTDPNLLYSSLQSENRIYAKLDYDYDEFLTVYGKLGYRKDDFIKALEPISGVQTTLGLEYTF